MNARKAVRSVLLGFVLISVGFALGKEFTLRSVRTAQDAAPAAGGDDKVIVYYVHATIRCMTCNKIEKMAHELVKTDFAKELEAGRLEWRTADFQGDEALARKYDIATSTLVLVKVEGGKEVRFRKLDEVWTLVEKPREFSAYVAGEISSFLGRGRS